MKRASELAALSREHHHSLRLAKRCLDTLASGDEKALRALCREIAADFDTTWERHFADEEAVIFSVTDTLDGEIRELGRRLVAEHDRMRELARRMAQGDCSGLESFGRLLRDHTRLEERRLFPLVERSFTPEQLAAVARRTGA